MGLNAGKMGGLRSVNCQVGVIRHKGHKVYHKGTQAIGMIYWNANIYVGFDGEWFGLRQARESPTGVYLSLDLVHYPGNKICGKYEKLTGHFNHF